MHLYISESRKNGTNMKVLSFSVPSLMSQRGPRTILGYPRRVISSVLYHLNLKPPSEHAESHTKQIGFQQGSQCFCVGGHKQRAKCALLERRLGFGIINPARLLPPELRMKDKDT